MYKKRLKTVAGYYFKSIIGVEPGTLEFTYENNFMQEYTFRATFDDRRFDIWMHPGHNLIELSEVRRNIFAEAAALAGMDRNLNYLQPEHEAQEKIIKSIYDLHERITANEEYRELLRNRENLEAHLVGKSIRELESIECFYQSLFEPEQQTGSAPPVNGAP